MLLLVKKYLIFKLVRNYIIRIGLTRQMYNYMIGSHAYGEEVQTKFHKLTKEVESAAKAYKYGSIIFSYHFN